MSHMQRTLPPELTDYIIDFVHDDPRTLANCLLVSKAWLDASRHHLFKVLKTCLATNNESPEGSPQTLRKLHYNLHTTPDILTYIQELQITAGRSQRYGDRQLVDLTDLAAVVTSMPALKTLKLELLGWEDEAPYADSDLLLQANNHGLQNLQIRTTLFNNFEDFCTIFWFFPNIKTLDVTRVGWQIDNSFPTAPPELSLHSLTINYMTNASDLFNVLRETGTVNTLRQLNLSRVIPEQVKSIATSLGSLAHGIVNLRLDCTTPSLYWSGADIRSLEDFWAALRLSKFAALQSLTLYFPPYSSEDETMLMGVVAPATRYWCSVMLLLPVISSNLRHLIFEILPTDIPDTRMPILKQLQDVDWDMLTIIIGSRFPNLQSMRVRFFADCVEKVWMTVLKPRLAKLEESGILHWS